MVDVIKAVTLGEIPKTTAQQIILASFPLEASRVSDMLRDVVEGSNKPAPEPTALPAPTNADDDTLDGKECIRKVGSKWVVRSRTTGNVLGEFETEEEAWAQLRAVAASKAARRKGAD